VLAATPPILPSSIKTAFALLLPLNTYPACAEKWPNYSKRCRYTAAISECTELSSKRYYQLRRRCASLCSSLA